MGAHVFLSYASADRVLAERISKSLDDVGLTVTRPEAPTPDAPVFDVLKKTLAETDLMVVIVPQEGSAGSNNVSFEVGAAEGLNKPVVAVVRNATQVEDLRRFQRVSAADIPGLVAQVQAALKRSGVSD